MQDIVLLQKQASADIEAATDISQLESIRVEYLGKKGKLSYLLKGLSGFSPEERPKMGALANQAKHLISDSIEQKMTVLKEQQVLQKLLLEQKDVTLPGRNKQTGSVHPITQIKQRINQYFAQLGFDIVDGPEVETEFYNFEALNIPSSHPARAMHDTF
jgi:phenylalanyl-tRNA synthetase alpha chain